MEEVPLFSSSRLTVTPTRIIAKDTTYAVKQVVAVEARRYNRTISGVPSWLAGPAAFLMFSFFIFFASIYPSRNAALTCLTLAIVLCLLGIERPFGSLRITLTSGRTVDLLFRVRIPFRSPPSYHPWAEERDAIEKAMTGITDTSDLNSA